MLDWMDGLTQQQSAFVGTLAGSSLGLVAILVGALVNAALNRRRDQQLREEERVQVTAALVVELKSIALSFRRNAAGLLDPNGERGSHFVAPDPVHMAEVYRRIGEKLFLLHPPALTAAIEVHAILSQTAETMLTQFNGSQLLKEMPADRSVLLVPIAYAASAGRMVSGVATDIEKACQAINETLPRARRLEL